MVILALAASIEGPEIHRTILMRRVKDSIISIETPLSQATGFLIKTPSNKIRIMTAAHVCKDPTLILKSVLSPTYDLCLINIELTGPPLKLGKQISPLETIFLVGFPYEKFSIITGFPMNKEEIQGFLVWNAILEGAPGASGSPIINKFGEVLGVWTMYAPREHDLHSYFEPLEHIKEFLADK